MAEQKEQKNVNLIGLENPETKNRKHTMPHWFYVAIGTFLYAGIWSYIGILKILSLNAYVFDLGISSERGWQVLHTNLGLHGYFTMLINSGIVFPLSPLTDTGNFFAMIIFQSFFIAIVGPAIYLIAREKGLKSAESMLLSLAFFLYFPVYGIMWYDFHYQVFFMPLFAFAYLLYLKKSYVASTLLFFLSGIVRYPYSIFPLGFATIELLLLFQNRQSGYDRRRMVSLSLLFIIMVTWTVLGFLIFGLSSTIPHYSISQYTVTDSPTWSRLYVILLFLAPLLFLPVLRARWIILVLPAFYLFLTSSYTWYSYPHIFQGQYVAGVVPFLFIGLIDYLGMSVKHKDGKDRTIPNKIEIYRKKSIRRSVVAILIILLFLNIFFAPFSPLNNQLGDQFNFQQNISYSPQQYSELYSMVKLIPSSETFVIYQNNIPELFPRPLPPSGSILMGSYLGSLINVSVGEAINNSWQVSAGGNEMSVPVEFALADALNPNFYLESNSVYSIVHNMYESGKYGIVSEGYGLILLQRNYNETIKNYVPENVTISGNSFFSSPTNHLATACISSNNSGVGAADFKGIQLYLFPGIFKVDINMNSQYQVNFFNSTHVYLRVYSGSNLLKTITGNISATSTHSGSFKATFFFALNTIAGNVWYSFYGPNSNFGIHISEMTVLQTSPLQNN